MRPPITLISIPVIVLLGGLALFTKHKTLKRVWVTLFIVALIAGLAFVGYGWWNRQAQADPLADGNVEPVTRGEITVVVEATGNMSPAALVPVAFSIPGQLVELSAATGDHVQAGEVLARLDTQDLELQRDQALASLDVAEANLENLLAGPRSEDVDVAQSSVNQSVANVEELRVTLSAATEQARLSWVQSANALRDAQANYENIYWDNREAEQELKKHNQELPDARLDAEAQAWRAVENAEAAMEQARLSYEQALQRQDSSLRVAQSQVTSSLASLERLTGGASSEEIAVTEASVEQARVGYEISLAQLEKASLTAPFDGVVTTVLVKVYDQVSSATPILILADLSSYYIDVEVDEVDISEVEVGQEVLILLDALPDVELTGEVEEVALSPSAGQGIVTYRVRVQVTTSKDAEVRPGMTANVRIVTQRASDVVIVPRRAVNIDEDGKPYVERVLPDGQLEQVYVELGLSDPFNVEIVSGVEVGDEVFVRGVVERDQIQQIFLESRPGEHP